MKVTLDRPQYSSVPYPLHHAVRQRKLTFVHIAVYAALDYYRNRQTREARPGLRTLAADLKMGRNRLKLAMAELVEQGFVRLCSRTGPRTPQSYEMCYSPSARAGGKVGPQRTHSAALQQEFRGIDSGSRNQSLNQREPEHAIALPGPDYCMECGGPYQKRWIQEGELYRRDCQCGSKVVRMVMVAK